VVTSCEHGNENSCTIRSREFVTRRATISLTRTLLHGVGYIFTYLHFYFLTDLLKSYDRSVGIALGYGLDDWGPRFQFPVGAGNFSLHHCVQNDSGAHPASYPMGKRDSFPGGKVNRA
jgi:hypothetical protein